MSEIGVILITVLIILILYFIARSGMMFIFLRCPKCKIKGGLRKQWKYLDKDFDHYDHPNLLDVNIGSEFDKILICRRCGNEINLSNHM